MFANVCVNEVLACLDNQFSEKNRIAAKASEFLESI